MLDNIHQDANIRMDSAVSHTQNELNNKIKLIKGEKINFKITTKEDYEIGKTHE